MIANSRQALAIAMAAVMLGGGAPRPLHGAETVGPDGLNLPIVQDLLRQEALQATWAMADLEW